MKNYTITVNGNVYDVTVEEGTGSAATPAAKAAPKAAKKCSTGWRTGCSKGNCSNAG